jgi:hypothetical protein
MVGERAKHQSLCSWNVTQKEANNIGTPQKEANSIGTAQKA